MVTVRFTFVFLIGALLAAVASANRKFSPNMVVGFYGRFFEVVPGTGGTRKCSRIVSNFKNAEPTGNGDYAVDVASIQHGGNNCDTGEMILSDTPDSNPAAGVGLSDSIFENLSKESTGFLVGTSNRTCGVWTLPNPTAVFMAYEEEATIYGPFDVPLPPKVKYTIFTNAEYTCVYRSIPKPAPKPIEAGGDGVSESAETDGSETVSGTIGIPVTVLPPSPSSEMEEPEASAEDEDDGSVCFPEDATVELEDGSTKKMYSVAIGDRVLVGPSTYSDVFMFTHKLSNVKHNFVKITTAVTTLSLTKGHYLYVNGVLSAAKAVNIGDTIELASGTSAVVENVSIVTGKGLYNPQTVHGDIVVNNVRASTYTTAVEPGLASTMLTPLRALYKATGVATCILDHGADRIAKLIPSGASSF